MSRISPPKQSPPEDASLRESLLYDLEALQKDESTCDVEFIVGHEKIRAHRLIVIARCERYKTKRGQWLLGDREGGTISILLNSKHHNASTVRAVIKYLYTGKISLHSLNPFRILLLCPELGLPALQTHTIHHIKSTLAPDTVCQVLLAANSVLKDCKGEQVNPSLQEIVQGCLDYISVNTDVVFAGDGYLALHKSMLASIISNNKLSVSQDDVWRAVVRWGQHHTGVDSGPGEWREGERIKMEETLDGLLEHVRVMEISDEVFTNEVEPTGLLSVETALAKYRQGSVENGVQEPFADSAILTGRSDLQGLIAEWCDQGESEWKLLYRGSRDGFRAVDFHTCCDNQGPTVVLVRTTSGCVFGGYTDASWNSRFKRGKFAVSQCSCLFTIINPSQTPPTRYLIKQPAYASNNHPSNGPIFGSGADLFISSECNINKDSYSQLGHSYGDSGVHSHLLTGEQYFTVGDYEVFCLQT